MKAGKAVLLVFMVMVSLCLVDIQPVGASLEMWSQTYGGPGGESARAMVQTSDGGYALAGDTSSFGAGADDFWLVKTDANGNVEWNQTYGGAQPDRAYSLVETFDGGFALAGYTYSFGVGIEDFWLVKTNMYGNMEWNQTYGGAGFDRAYSLVETSDGVYTLAGDTDSFGPGYQERWEAPGPEDVWLVKTDGKGVVSIVSPDNKTYTVYNVSLTFTFSEPAAWMGYSLDGQDNVTINGNTTLAGLSNGSHNITVYAKDSAGRIGASETVHFNIEVLAPEPQPSEPFPAWVVVALVIIAVVAAALLVYFRKLKKTTEKAT